MELKACKLLFNWRDRRDTHIENDEEDEVDAVEKNEYPEKPPVGLAGKEKCKTPTGMIQ